MPCGHPESFAEAERGPLAYSINVNANATSFTLTAAPDSGGPMAGDACGSFTLNQLGQKALTGNTLTMAECWSK